MVVKILYVGEKENLPSALKKLPAGVDLVVGTEISADYSLILVPAQQLENLSTSDLAARTIVLASRKQAPQVQQEIITTGLAGVLEDTDPSIYALARKLVEAAPKDYPRITQTFFGDRAWP